MADSPEVLRDLIEEIIPETIGIINGRFDVPPIPGNVPSDTSIVNAIITELPFDETGTIDEILITRSDKSQFHCGPIDVTLGTDLIQACRQGPIDLPRGETIYEAHGSNFGPELDTFLGIKLYTE